MVSTRRQAQEDPPAPVTRAKAPARSGRKKAVPVEETKETPAAPAPVKKAPAPKKSATTRTRATRSKVEPEEEQQVEEITKPDVEDEPEKPAKTTATTARATRAKAPAKTTTRAKKVAIKEQPTEEQVEEPVVKAPSKLTSAPKRATRAKAAKKEEPATEPEAEPEVQEEVPELSKPATRKTRATAASKTAKPTTTKAKASSATTKSKAKAAPKAPVRATRATRAKKAEEQPQEELSHEGDGNKEMEEDHDHEIPEAKASTSEDALPSVPELDDPFNPQPLPEPARIKIDMNALRPHASPVKATPMKLLSQTPSKSIMQKIAELPASAMNRASPSKLPRPQDKDEEMADVAEYPAPTPFFNRSTTTGRTPLLKSSMFSASARKPPVSARKFFGTSPSQSLVKPSGQAVDEKQKLGSSLFSASPRKIHFESSLFKDGPKNKQSSESEKTSALSASPRKVKLTSPAVRFESGPVDKSASVQRPFGKSSLFESPRRLKTPGRTPKTAPISSMKTFLDGTPTRLPPKFTLTKHEVIVETSEDDNTIMFDEPEFPCMVETSTIKPTPTVLADDDVFGVPVAAAQATEAPSPSTEVQFTASPVVQITEDTFDFEPVHIASELPISRRSSLAEPETSTPQQSVSKRTSLVEPKASTPAQENREAQPQEVSTTPSTPKQQPMLLAPATLERPKLSPRKSSLKSPEKKSLESPKKTVTWQQLTQKNTPTTKIEDLVLQGTVFFVDVRGSDGSDASNLFVPLLEELGASCVPQWTSNNMDLTHVLFKDGEKRTLEKVVASNGMVKCVNIGWALE